MCGNPICSFNDRYFDRNYAIAIRSGPLQKTIYRYKYDEVKGWALIFGRMLVAFLDLHRNIFSNFGLIVASPSFLERSGQGRRWDHTRLVLESANLAAPGRWPFDLGNPAAIIKTRATTAMVKKTWRQRKNIAEGELREALTVPRPRRTRNRKILVYDDIFTDGFTLREAAGCLIEEGKAAVVCGLTLARQPWRR